jgi:hypothetical protein
MRILFIDQYGSDPLLFANEEEFLDHCNTEEVDFDYEYNGRKNEAFFIPDDLKRVVVAEQARYRIVNDEPIAATVTSEGLPLQDMRAVERLLGERQPEGFRGSPFTIHGKSVIALGDSPNDYGDLKIIPKGAEVVIDFGGDFGFYGTTVIDGVLLKVRVDLKDLHRFDWRPLI